MKGECMVDYKIIEKYDPRSRAAVDDRVISVTDSGHIAVSGKTYEDWLAPANRVNLYFLSADGKPAIGIQAAATHQGLAVIGTRNCRSRYISARGFISKYKIPQASNRRYEAVYDQKHGMVIAVLTHVGKKRMEVVPDNTLNTLNILPAAPDLGLALLEILPLMNNNSRGLSKPEIIKTLAEKLEKQGPSHKGRRQRRQWYNHIAYLLARLESEGKVLVRGHQPYRGKTMKFYCRAQQNVHTA